MNKFLFRCLPRTLALVAQVMSGLSAAPLVGTAAAGPATNPATYAVTGLFMESRSAGRIAVIAHEKIPGYMDAMTMPFNVKKPAELKGIQPGDKIAFRLSATATEDWIDQIKKIGSRATTTGPAPTQTDSGKELEPGALIPDCILTNQEGRVIHTAEFKGQALAFTFFFSRCPLPSFCPRMNNNLAAAQRALRPDATRTNWQLLSISFDPGFDTPENLKGFATLLREDSYHWDFATAGSDELRKLGGAFGLQFWRENGSFSHNLRTVVVNAAGRVQRVFKGNEWQPAELIEEVRKAMTTNP
jgi:protein SCO1/2